MHRFPVRRSGRLIVAMVALVASFPTSVPAAQPHCGGWNASCSSSSTVAPGYGHQSCGNVQMKVDFSFVQQSSTSLQLGNGQNSSAGAFFPLQSNGTVIADSSLIINPHQLSVRRQPGFVEFFARNPTGPDESRLHGTITIQGGTFTSANNHPVSVPDVTTPGANVDLEADENDFVNLTSSTTAEFSLFWSYPGDGFTLSYVSANGSNCSSYQPPFIPSDQYSGTCNDSNAQYLFSTDLLANDSNLAGPNPVNNVRLPAGTYLFKYQGGAWSPYDRDGIDTSEHPGGGPNLTWLGTADVVTPSHHERIGANGYFSTANEAEAAAKKKYVVLSVGDGESTSIYIADQPITDNRGNVNVGVYRCPGSAPSVPVPQCRDGIDNDGDGRIDYNDPGCYQNGQYNPNDNDETDQQQRPQCSDGIDNDYDGRIDMNDPGCSGPNDNDERDPVQQNGCIVIRKITKNTVGQNLTPVAQFTFRLDGNRTTFNDSTGFARFTNVPVGQHTVSEVVPVGWRLTSTSPSGGRVTVNPGDNCAQVTFTNMQNPIGPCSGYGSCNGDNSYNTENDSTWWSNANGYENNQNQSSYSSYGNDYYGTAYDNSGYQPSSSWGFSSQSSYGNQNQYQNAYYQPQQNYTWGSMTTRYGRTSRRGR